MSSTGLTRRHIEIIECLAKGLSYRETAARLGISPPTVKAHRARIGRALDATNGAHVVALACAYRLINPRELLGIRD